MGKPSMQMPVQIAFRHLDPSAAVESRARELARELEHFSSSILRCRVTIDCPHKHQTHGRKFEVHLEITVPDKQIMVSHAHPASDDHENLYMALRDAFDAAKRQLQEYERIRRRDVKAHSAPSV
jgi:ribosome-associated translation inhibitor RaiA